MAKTTIIQQLPREYRLMNTGEVAELLGVSQSHLCTMRDMPDEGGLHVTYVGSKRTPRYAVKDVQRFIEQGGTPVSSRGLGAVLH